MKLRAFVLTAGLIALGANASWAFVTCKTNDNGPVRNSGDKCTSKSYKFNKNSKCKCPGDNPNATKKCSKVLSMWEPGRGYSCEEPF